MFSPKIKIIFWQFLVSIACWWKLSESELHWTGTRLEGLILLPSNVFGNKNYETWHFRNRKFWSNCCKDQRVEIWNWSQMRNVETCCRRGDWGLYWFSMTRELISLLKCETLKYEIWNYEIWEYQIYMKYGKIWYGHICVEYMNLGKYDILDFGLSLISEKWRCQIWNWQIQEYQIIRNLHQFFLHKNALKKDWSMPAPTFLKLYWNSLNDKNWLCDIKVCR